ncbi:hypothetical protein ACWDR5_19600 [Streptomyces koyangensis]
MNARYRVPVRVLIAVGDAEPSQVATGTLTDATDMGAVLRDMADAYDRAVGEPCPMGARLAADTLSIAAGWFGSGEVADTLCDVAANIRVNWDGIGCPMCEETRCDAGCPLESIRAEIPHDPGAR